MRLFAVLRERAGTSELSLDDLDDGLDLGGLKRELARRRPELAATLERVAGAIGTDYVDDAHPLREGDEVCLLPPVSGGSQDAREDAAADLDVFELCAAPLDPGAAFARVVHPACGGTTLFVGTTRATNRGERVVRLEYEAYDAMTGPEMARIFERCRAELGVAASGVDAREHRLRLFVQHRVGSVEIGEPSVVVAVASPHRDLAFRACRYLIDELKRTLPVWKKELYADGHHWIGDRS